MFILLVRRMNISFLDGEIPGTCTHSEGKTRNIDNFRFVFFITHRHRNLTTEFLLRWRGPGFRVVDSGFVAVT